MADDRCDLLCLDLEKAERLRAQQPGPQVAGRAAERAKALADPTRLVIAVGARRRPTSSASATWPGSPGARRTSSPITCARCASAGLAASRRDGKMVLYSLTPTGSALVRCRRRARLRHERLAGAAVATSSRSSPGVTSMAARRGAGAPAVVDLARLDHARRRRRRHRPASLAGSVALTGFGLSSAVEGLASVIVIWRFTGSRTHSATAETTAQKAVAISFWLLAPYVAIESILHLLSAEQASTSIAGIIVTCGSIVFMPMLGRAKLRLGARLGSGATAGEGTQNILCALLAGATLVGLLGQSLLGVWWLDPLAGLFIAGVAVREGFKAWSGEVCADCAPVGFTGAPTCNDGCCD